MKLLTRNNNDQAFTLLELVIVMLIIGTVSAFFSIRLGTFDYWKQEGGIRGLTELLEFLHHQAVSDQAFYKLEFNLESQEYRVGVLRSGAVIEDEDLKAIAADAGALTLELASFLNPSLVGDQTMIPPPAFPSLAEPKKLGPHIELTDMRTMRGKHTKEEGGEAYILFSPRGFSEFAVLHLSLGEERPATILVNPFTGLTEIFREYKDFEWTFGRGKEGNSL